MYIYLHYGWLVWLTPSYHHKWMLYGDLYTAILVVWYGGVYVAFILDSYGGLCIANLIDCPGRH